MDKDEARVEEARRLEVSTALAHVTEAHDRLTSALKGLTDEECVDVQFALDIIMGVRRSLEKRRAG